MAAWNGGQRWDVLVCSDMLDLAQFQGLLSSRMAGLPSVAYFHENQLTYPQQSPSERDLHFAFTNFVTALAANQVWFNSAFHQQDFLGALNQWFARMPDYAPREAVDAIQGKSRVQSPGIETGSPQPGRASGPLRIAWAARWEHDKNPETFFAAIRILRKSGADFRLSVFGQTFPEIPSAFLDAHEQLKTHVDHWGYVDSHEDYLAKMSRADVFVSTANHEFFGLAAMEAISLGLRPLLPQRLAYPELLGRASAADTAGSNFRISDFFYDGSAEELADRLARFAARPDEVLLERHQQALQRAANRYSWQRRALEMDSELECLLKH
jgi:glycosyltransferase involved in cell wall biosynthesis